MSQEYYDLDAKTNPTCAISIKIKDADTRLRVLEKTASFAQKHGMRESTSGFRADGSRLAPLYSNDALALSTFIMDLVPDKSEHYIQMRLDCVKKNFPFASFEEIGQEFLDSWRPDFEALIDYEEKPAYGEG